MKPGAQKATALLSPQPGSERSAGPDVFGVRSIVRKSDVPFLAGLLAPFFASSSLFTPPVANGPNGNRIVALTNRSTVAAVKDATGFTQIQPADQTTITLAAGSATWTFAQPFKAVPVISIAAEGVPPGAPPAVLYIDTVDALHVIVKSTVNTDTRKLHLSAQGNQ